MIENYNSKKIKSEIEDVWLSEVSKILLQNGHIQEDF